MFKQNKKAFTLVELIVVITILAILGTIAFISLQGYSKDARDSARTSDISRLKTSLELFQLDAGKYPETTDSYVVTYKGGATWNQGTFGDSTFNNVEKLDKLPKDPLTDREYIYSVTNTRQEYEIAGIMEGDTIGFNPLLLNKSLAGDKLAKAKITGNYNGKILKVSTGGLIYVLAVPSLISSSQSILEDIILNNKFVFNGYKNLPFQYEGSSYNTEGEEGSLLLVNPSSYELYSGSTLEGLSDEDSTERIKLLENLKTAYLGTSISGDNTIQEILSITDFTSTNPIAVSLAGTVVNNTLGASITTNTIVDGVLNCDAGTKVGTNATYTYSALNSGTTIIGNGTKTVTHGSIAYSATISCNNGTTSILSEIIGIATCSGGYTGSSCEIVPLTGWRALDSNCDIDDIVIGTQTWAGCNSTLGDGLEFIENASNSCYDYTGLITTGCNGPSNEKENVYNSTYGINNIWGKLYTWSNSDSACPTTGRHVPSETEFNTLENYITSQNGGDSNIGWSIRKTKTDKNNLVNALQIPLNGFLNFTAFNNRGRYAYFWSSTPSSTNAYSRYISSKNSVINHYIHNQNLGFSVRCIKN